MEQRKNTEKESPKGRILYVDLLNITACFGVVCLHCSNTVFEYRGEGTWYFALLIQTAFYWCVPVFFMLTGATLLGYRKKYTTGEYLKRRVLRVLLPFLLWSTILLIWKLHTGELAPEEWNIILSWYLNNGIESIYWFFYPLIGMYLTIPIASILTEDRYKTCMYYVTGVSLAVTCVLQYSYLAGIYYDGSLTPVFANGYLAYLFLGWILARSELSGRCRLLIYCIGLGCGAAMFAGSVLLTLRDGALNLFFFNYTGPTAYGMAAAVFVWFRYHDWTWLASDGRRGMIGTLAGASFGVYLIQMRVIGPLIWNTPEHNTVVWMTAGAVLIYLFCVLIVIAGKKVPVVRRLFP